MLPVFDDDVFEFIAEELFARLFKGGLDFDEVGEDTGGLEVVGLTALDGGEEALDGLGGVGAMVEDFFEGILAGFEAAEFGADLFELTAGFADFGLTGGEFAVDELALVGKGFDFGLAIGEAEGELRFHLGDAGEVCLRAFGFAGGAGAVPLVRC